MVSGSYSLSKEEWVGVLTLSTIWQMKAVSHVYNRLDAQRLSGGCISPTFSVSASSDTQSGPEEISQRIPRQLLVLDEWQGQGA